MRCVVLCSDIVDSSEIRQATVEVGSLLHYLSKISGETIATSHDQNPQKVAFWRDIPISGTSRLVKY